MADAKLAEQIARECIAAGIALPPKKDKGLPPAALLTAVGVCLAESGGDPSRRHVNKDGSVDRGWWQLNSKWHAEVPDSCAYNAKCSTREAMRISGQGRNWSQWRTFTSGAYLKYATDSAVAAGCNVAFGQKAPDDPTEKPSIIPNTPGIGTAADLLGSLGTLLGKLLSGDLWKRLGLIVAGAALALIGWAIVHRDTIGEALGDAAKVAAVA